MQVYDDNGNLNSGGTRALTWNGENQPATVNGVELAYAPDGERLSKRSGIRTVWDLGGDVELEIDSITKNPVWTKYLHPDAKLEGTKYTGNPGAEDD